MQVRRKETLTDDTSWTALADDERLTVTEDGKVCHSHPIPSVLSRIDRGVDTGGG